MGTRAAPESGPRCTFIFPSPAREREREGGTVREIMREKARDSPARPASQAPFLCGLPRAREWGRDVQIRRERERE